jgi:hypothetical protein
MPRSRTEEADVEGRPHRDAGFPGDSVTFEVVPISGCAEQDIRWSSEGDPATGAGRRFRTTFATGGTHRVTASCGEDSAEFRVSIWPLDEWLSRAETFFGPSVDLSRVKVKASWAVFGPSGTGWTCNTVVRFKRARRAEDLPVEATLIHELTHVWEHRSGQAQLLKGIVEQTGRMFGRDPYDYGGPEGVRQATSLRQFKKEGQAQIVMEYWKSQNGYSADSKGVSLSTPGYVADLRRLVDEAGIGRLPGDRRTLVRGVDAVFARAVNGVLSVVE